MRTAEHDATSKMKLAVVRIRNRRERESFFAVAKPGWSLVQLVPGMCACHIMYGYLSIIAGIQPG